MSTIYSAKAIGDLVGKRFRTQTTPNGHFQVNLDLGSFQNDEEKCQALLEAAETLRGAGYTDPVVRLSYKSQDQTRGSKGWVPWPHVFIRKPTITDRPALPSAEYIQSLRDIGMSNDEIIRMVTAGRAGVSVEASENTTSESQSETPDEPVI